MKKYIIAIAAALATAFGASAADYAYTLVLNRADGTKSNFLFSDIPIATIEGDDLNILENITGISVIVPIADIVNFTFEKELIPDGVENVSLEAARVSFALTRESLDVKGLSESTEVLIFDAKGALCVKGSSDSNGAITLDISSLDKGVFLVKAGNNSFKFIR